MNMFDVLKNPKKIKNDEPLREEAIKKIETEIEQNKDDTQINIIGQVLIKYLKENAVAEKILNPENNIKNCVKEMVKIAATKIRNPINYNNTEGAGVFLSYEEGLNIILEYFEIEETEEVKL